jgi:Big-like domain-containing protein/calcineurin-like phosphoesterase family protein
MTSPVKSAIRHPKSAIRVLLALPAIASLAACADSPGPSGYSISLAPEWVAVATGDSAQLTPTALDPQGYTPLSPSITWSSSNPTVAQVSITGMVRGLSAGTATIRAGYEDASDSAAVLVAPPVLVGAGDIAACGRTQQDSTAALLDTIPGVVFTAGDNAYTDGTITQYLNCYHPNWGRQKSRTRPSPGNHEYNTAGLGYYEYFGALAGDSGIGYFSYDFATWHIISLNSNVSMIAGSPQEQWLRADLSLHPAPCSLAYWHHPRFSSGTTHGNEPQTQPLWQALYDHGADVVISGHEHQYERFAPQKPDSTPDATNGIREFVVGTGGAALYPFGPVRANSEVRNNTTHGVIKLTLSPTGYAWKYITTAGVVADSGSGSCH